MRRLLLLLLSLSVILSVFVGCSSKSELEDPDDYTFSDDGSLPDYTNCWKTPEELGTAEE